MPTEKMNPDSFAPQSKGRSPGKNYKPKKEVDWDMVKKLCQIQCTQDEIAAVLEISEDTLIKAFKEVFEGPPRDRFREWRKGGNCSLRRKQWKLADSNAGMAIFLGKQYLGQEDDYGHKHTGNVPVTVTNFGDGDPEPWINKNADEEKK